MSRKPVGMRNPWALAEARLGVPIDWDRIPNAVLRLAELLSIPEDRVFSPTESPLYPANAHLAPPWLKKFLRRVPVWSDRGSAGTPSWHQIRQNGGLTDCYVVAPLIALSFVDQPVQHDNVATSDPENPRHRFRLFTKPQDPKTFEVDERLPYQLSSCLLALGDSSSMPPHELLPGLAEKALLCLLDGSESDTPSLLPLQQPGHASTTLVQLTGRQPKTFDRHAISKFLDDLATQPTTDGRCTLATVASISEDLGTWISDENLSGSHSYALLGLVQHQGSPVVIVCNPTQRRGPDRTEFVWDVLDDVPWLEPHSVRARGSGSGVIPVPRALFEEVFSWIDVA